MKHSPFTHNKDALPKQEGRLSKMRTKLLAKSFNDFLRSLNELKEYAFGAKRELVVRARVHEADVEAAGALADAARREAHAFGREPLDALREVVDPEADVVELRLVHLRLLFRVDRLHDVDFHSGRALAHAENVLIDVFALALEGLDGLKAHDAAPEVGKLALVEAADGDLLNSENFEWSV